MTAAEKYPHILSVIEAQICAEAWKAAQYEKFDAETATSAKSRCEDWTALRAAINEGALDEAKFDLAVRRALIGGAV